MASPDSKAAGGFGALPEANTFGFRGTTVFAAFAALSGGSNVPLDLAGLKIGGGCGARPEERTFDGVSFFKGGSKSFDV